MPDNENSPEDDSTDTTGGEGEGVALIGDPNEDDEDKITFADYPDREEQ